MARGSILPIVVGSCLVGSCGGDAPRQMGGREILPAELRIAREFPVDESDSVLNVSPAVRIDPAGGFLVADSRERKVRRYSSAGSLTWQFGQGGSGPGEFASPMVALRTPEGEVVVADWNDRLTILSPDGDSARRAIRTGLQHIEDIDIIGDSVLLVSGILAGERSAPRLHVVHLAKDSIIRSFFRPFDSAADPGIATIAGWVAADVSRERIAAVFPVIDTVYLFTLDQEQYAAIHIPSAHYRPPVAPDAGVWGNARERSKWLASFDLVVAVYWLGPERLLVTSKTMDGVNQWWHWLVMDTAGRRILELRDGPRVLDVVSGTDSLLIVHPSAEVPNRWAIAVLPPGPSS